MLYHRSILFPVLIKTKEIGVEALKTEFCVTEFGLQCNKFFSLAVVIGLYND